MPKTNCQVEGCTAPAKYGIYKTNSDGTKVWLKVCKLHDKQIGDENMARAGGYYNRKKKEGEK